MALQARRRRTRSAAPTQANPRIATNQLSGSGTLGANARYWPPFPTLSISTPFPWTRRSDKFRCWTRHTEGYWDRTPDPQDHPECLRSELPPSQTRHSLEFQYTAALRHKQIPRRANATPCGGPPVEDVSVEIQIPEEPLKRTISPTASLTASSVGPNLIYRGANTPSASGFPVAKLAWITAPVVPFRRVILFGPTPFPTKASPPGPNAKPAG